MSDIVHRPAHRPLAIFGSDRGASAVEYALLIAGIAAIIIVAVTFVGRTVSAQFSKVGSSIASTN